jgi:hypothetical protein
MLRKHTYNAVVIGGSCMGSSIAYHLAQAGITDVLVVERDPSYRIASAVLSVSASRISTVQLGYCIVNMTIKLRHCISASRFLCVRLEVSDNRSVEIHFPFTFINPRSNFQYVPFITLRFIQCLLTGQFSLPENIKMSIYGAEFLKAPEKLAVDGAVPDFQVQPYCETHMLSLFYN